MSASCRCFEYKDFGRFKIMTLECTLTGTVIINGKTFNHKSKVFWMVFCSHLKLSTCTASYNQDFCKWWTPLASPHSLLGPRLAELARAKKLARAQKLEKMGVEDFASHESKSIRPVCNWTTWKMVWEVAISLSPTFWQFYHHIKESCSL